MIDETNRTIGNFISKFLKEDMKKMHETKGYFNKISNDLDTALSKNAATSKSRPTDMEDSSNLLTATRSCFRYTSMDYVYQISMLQSQKRSVVLDSIGNVYLGVYYMILNLREKQRLTCILHKLLFKCFHKR